MPEFKSFINEEKRRVMREIADKGQEIYDRLVKEEGLEEKYRGFFIVIDVDTGEYVLGKTAIEVYDEADKKFPGARQCHAQVGVSTYV